MDEDAALRRYVLEHGVARRDVAGDGPVAVHGRLNDDGLGLRRRALDDHDERTRRRRGERGRRVLLARDRQSVDAHDAVAEAQPRGRAEAAGADLVNERRAADQGDADLGVGRRLFQGDLEAALHERGLDQGLPGRVLRRDRRHAYSVLGSGSQQSTLLG